MLKHTLVFNQQDQPFQLAEAKMWLPVPKCELTGNTSRDTTTILATNQQHYHWRKYRLQTFSFQIDRMMCLCQYILYCSTLNAETHGFSPDWAARNKPGSDRNTFICTTWPILSKAYPLIHNSGLNQPPIVLLWPAYLTHMSTSGLETTRRIYLRRLRFVFFNNQQILM